MPLNKEAKPNLKKGQFYCWLETRACSVDVLLCFYAEIIQYKNIIFMFLFFLIKDF